MSKVFCVSVMLLLLTALWSHHTALSRKFPSKNKLLFPFPCKCNYLSSKKLVCQRGYTFAETMEQIKCLCKLYSKGKWQHRHPDIKKLCKLQVSIPLPLV